MEVEQVNPLRQDADWGLPGFGDRGEWRATF